MTELIFILVSFCYQVFQIMAMWQLKNDDLSCMKSYSDAEQLKLNIEDDFLWQSSLMIEDLKNWLALLNACSEVESKRLG